MDKIKQKLEKIIKVKNSAKLQEFLHNMDLKILVQIISRSLNQTDGFALINSILAALNSDDENSIEIKIEVYKCILKLLKCNEILSEKESGQIVSTLIVHAENLPTHVLHSLILIYLDSLESNNQIVGRWSELLGKLISLTGKRSDINIDEQDYTGKEYQSYILNSLCKQDWNTKTATTLLSVFKDLKLSEEEIDEVLYKIENTLKNVNYRSVPSVLYNLILLCQEELPHKVIDIIVDYFNEQNASFDKEIVSNTRDDITSVSHSNLNNNGDKDELNEAAATMILHITHLSHSNSKLVKDYLKFVKNSIWLSKKLITPFNLPLALSLASIDRYKDQILDALKSCIMKHYRIKEKADMSLWIHNTCFDDYDIPQMFINTAKMCQFGWNQVSQGMLNLCFSLLECGVGWKGELYANQQAINIAITVMPVVIRKESHLTPYVLCQLSSYMFTAASSHRYLEMLNRLVKLIPHILLEHIDLVRDILEQMTLLPLHVAVELLYILLPLFKMSMILKDALVLILRKMLFSREIEKRQASVEGFILFLCHFRIMGPIPASQGSMSFASSLSQVSADVHTSFNSNTNEALCLEFLGILRRCFSQQAEVKSVLYYGFYDVVKSNPKLGPNIITILYQHLSNFIDTRQDVLNPLLFNKIVTTRPDTAVLNEPFGELLFALCECKSKYDSFIEKNDNSEEDEGDVAEILANVSSTCNILAEKLAHMDMDDMDFGNASFLTTTDKGKLNFIRAQVTIGTFDALMNYVFISGAPKVLDKSKLFMSLFKTQKILIDLVQKSCSKLAKKGEKEKIKLQSNKQITIKSILKLETAVKILKVIFQLDSDADSNCVEIFQQNSDLQTYLVTVVESLVKNLPNYPAQKRNKMLPHLKMAANLLLLECDKGLLNVDADDSTERNKISQVLHCFSLLYSNFFKLFNPRLPEVMQELVGGSDENLNSNLDALAKKFQNMSRISFGQKASKMTKESIMLMNLLSLTTQNMNVLEDLTNVHTWLHHICKNENIYSSNYCESIITLLYRVTDQIKLNNSLPRLIAKDIYATLGDNEDHGDTEETVSYQIITEETSLPVLSSTIAYVDESLSHIEMSLSVLRCCILLKTDYDRNSVEKCLVLKFGILMQSLHEIIKSAIPQSSSIDQIFKSTTKLCTVLTIFIRYYLDLFKLRKNNQFSDKFERLVYLYGTFKEEVFKMINYHQGTQSGVKSTALLTHRAMKESKIIPALIFSMEKYENLLVQLSKKSKINLMINVKLSTSRDFRISLPAMAKALEEMEQEQQQEEASGNESDETVAYSTEDGPAPKRSKKSE